MVSQSQTLATKSNFTKATAPPVRMYEPNVGPAFTFREGTRCAKEMRSSYLAVTLFVIIV